MKLKDLKVHVMEKTVFHQEKILYNYCNSIHECKTSSWAGIWIYPCRRNGKVSEAAGKGRVLTGSDELAKIFKLRRKRHFSEEYVDDMVADEKDTETLLYQQ